MAVLKNEKTGKWEVRTRYRDYTGAKKQKTKRGFDLKREAEAWERDFLLRQNDDLNMKFGDFVEQYRQDIKPRVRKSTYDTKDHMLRTKIVPYFKDRKINEITVADVIKWQTEIQSNEKKHGGNFSSTYLKSIHAQLSAVFNHAVRYYGLQKNPARDAGKMGAEESKEMDFWTLEEYLKFSEAIADKPQSYMAFQVLYWTGMREAEMLALTPADIDFTKKTIRINKQFHREGGRDIVSEPKTKKGKRTVVIPDFLTEELRNYLDHIYHIEDDQRIFNISKSGLYHEMERGSKLAGVKRIRTHDLRHSHISLLIDRGFSALAIGERVGHEAERITYRYAHLFPTVQTAMAKRLDEDLKEAFDVSKINGQEE